MRLRMLSLICFLSLISAGFVRAQQTPPASGAASPKAQEKKSPAAPQASPDKSSQDATAEHPGSVSDEDMELQIAVREAGQDSATLVKSLEAFLARHPDSPRRAAVYRALVESEMNLHNDGAALDYAEKVITIQPDDSQSMYVAVTLLEKKHDDASQLHAIDYDSRLIDRVSKADPESRPQQMTLEDWQAGRNKFLVDLYVLRGRMEYHLHKNDDAVKDLTSGFRMLPSAEAALTLGEIAEEGKHSDEAIRQYATAFALASDDQREENATPTDRDALRLRIGNLWHFTHDSTAGLGDLMLSAYDETRAAAQADKPEASEHNKDVTDPLQFSLRRVDGGAVLKLAESRGKVVVLNFWTTWCAYCNQMETMLAGVRTKFSGRDDVVFLALNADEDETAVAPFLQNQKPGGTLVFADGVNKAFHVESIPTVLVLDKAGKIAYRTQGFAPDGFADLASAAITKASSAAQ
ncbi:MAG TPA: TlpA disulfide reductase family protein [Candidatus Sulfotelmatobacter sp.]|nr:TlpA disulfide reductase family protein [Candidatus Sulfotelmatobacter sp.]